MDEKKNIESWSDAEKYIAEKLMSQNEGLAKSVIEQAKTSAKRWFVAWIITLAALVCTNAAWLYVFNSYEYVSQDGNGVNSINTGQQEGVDIGTENED